MRNFKNYIRRKILDSYLEILYIEDLCGTINIKKNSGSHILLLLNFILSILIQTILNAAAIRGRGKCFFNGKTNAVYSPLSTMSFHAIIIYPLSFRRNNTENQ
jgi:hypothetical protein